MQKMQERRRFVRLAPSLVVVTCKVLPAPRALSQPEARQAGIGQEGEGDSQTCLRLPEAGRQAAKDISQGGIRFSVGERLPNGVKLELELKLPEEAVPIQAQAEVVWCARFRDDGRYEVGCRFTHIDPLDRGKIIRRIHEALKQRKAFTS